MTDALDPRIHPVRDDLAAEHYRGRADRPRHAAGRPLRCAAAVAPLRGRPDPAASQTTEMVYGEDFTAYEVRDAWAWGQCARDRYVGYVEEAMLAAPGAEPGHAVAVPRTPLFSRPDFKSPLLGQHSLNARVAVEAREGDYARAGGGWIYAPHLAPLGAAEPDYVETALSLLSAPYVWGGNSGFGVDCSGLVQAALARAGIACPRDTDMQRDGLGEALPTEGVPGAERRGDLLFFPGHVGIVVAPGRLLHASSLRMRVVVEPLAEVLARVAKEHATPLLARRRIDPVASGGGGRP